MGNFYPQGWAASKMLAFYRERFDTVELNNSFYGLPGENALHLWRDSTADGFLFAMKGSRFLTHMKKLKEPEAGLAKFFSRADLLGRKLGPILWQLPPNWMMDVERLAYFLGALPAYHRHAFEFRNATWNTPEILQLLRSHNAAYCAYDLAGYRSLVEVTADFAYVRLHGPGGKYQGSYSDAALGEWAGRIREWRGGMKAIYVYFDNDDSGYAAWNAMKLREMVG